MDIGNNFYPNQRRVRINRNKVEKNSSFTFACIYRYSIENAMQNLKPSTFKVWLYLASNKDKHYTEYSSSYLSKVVNISVNTAKTAFHELKDKGYIIEDENNKYFFEFYEEPQTQKRIKLMKERREFVDEETQEIYQLTFSELLDIVKNEDDARAMWESANNETESKK